MATAELYHLNPDGEHGAKHLIPQLAHEVRQPLSTLESISCYLDLILPANDTRACQQVDKMQQLLQQTDWILSDAIHFLGAAARHPVLVDWNEVITGIVSEGEAKPGVDIQFSFADGLPPTLFDLDQAKHLVLGLFYFLRRLANSSGPVSIHTSHGAAEVLLEFSIATQAGTAEPGEEWFQPFTTNVPAGYGLALASARQIVQAHLGRIGIQRRDVDGIVCSICLPIVERSQVDMASST